MDAGLRIVIASYGPLQFRFLQETLAAAGHVPVAYLVSRSMRPSTSAEPDLLEATNAIVADVPRKHSAHARSVMGSAGCRLALRGGCLRGRSPGRAEHEGAQDVHGVLAVLAGGVDVASDVEAVLGDVVAGEAAGDFLLGFQRADAALRDIVRRPDAGVLGEQQDVAAPAVAEFQQLAAWFLLRAVLGAGIAVLAGQSGEDRVPELMRQRVPDDGGDEGKSLLAGRVPFADQAAQRPLRLGRPDGARVALGAVLEVPQQVRQACLVPGDVLPPGVEVILV